MSSVHCHRNSAGHWPTILRVALPIGAHPDARAKLEQQEAHWYGWRRLIFRRTTEIREETMQSRLGIGGVVLALSAALSVQTAAAGPQEDVAAAANKWATVFAENNPDTILALYAKDA